MAANNTPTEHQEQVALIQWCRLKKIFIFAIANGGNRNIVTATMLKAEGVIKGVPDLFLTTAAGGWHGLFIELKRLKGSSTSTEQKAVHAILRGQNYKVVVCKGWIEATKQIDAYLKGEMVE
jgi:hypothetical protein